MPYARFLALRAKFLALTFVLAGGFAASLPVTAQQQQFFRCEASNGVVEYSNMPASGRDRNCRSLDLPPVTTIPAPKLPASAAPTSPRSGGGASTQPLQARASPDSFPRVEPAAQRSRDSDRRRIIEDELRKEESRLGEMRKEFNNGEPERRGDERNYQKYLDRVARLKDDIGRGEQNIASLKRELAAIRD